MTKDKKNEILINYMKQNPLIKKMYAVFAKVEDGAFLFDPQTNDNLVKTWIDGREYHRFSFIINNYISYSINPVSSNQDKKHENLLEIEDMQSIINWFQKQVRERNFPDFGDHIQIEEMYCVTTEPVLEGVNDEMSPPIACYRMEFALEYIEDVDAEYEEENNNLSL